MAFLNVQGGAYRNSFKSEYDYWRAMLDTVPADLNGTFWKQRRLTKARLYGKATYPFGLPVRELRGAGCIGFISTRKADTYVSLYTRDGQVKGYLVIFPRQGNGEAPAIVEGKLVEELVSMVGFRAQVP